MKQKFVVTLGMTLDYPNKVTKKDIKHLCRLNLQDIESLTKLTVRSVDFD